MTFCEINDLNCVITDAKPSDEYIEYFNDNNVDLTTRKTGGLL